MRSWWMGAIPGLSSFTSIAVSPEGRTVPTRGSYLCVACAKEEHITSGEGLDAAKGQKQAMAKAKRSLDAATEDATKKDPGYRPVSAMPRIEDGHPIATVIPEPQ